jgi:prolyl-tRNA synthetase
MRVRFGIAPSYATDGIRSPARDGAGTAQAPGEAGPVMSEALARDVVKEIPPKAADLSAWYTAACLKAQLVSYSPVRGCVVLRPYGFALWENLQKHLDVRFKATGHENAYFPLFIPESLLVREAEHVEGFAPEVAWVTQGGNEKLTERLAVRPTSEAMIGTMYAQWIESYRDLPILINQWANVVRWEKATRPFLRTMEFLWQEGHTAHATGEEAREETLRILDLYRDFAENVAAVPVYSGRKSPGERFPGAVETFSIEALMPDGKALQSGTSHDLGQNFAKAYDIKFVDADQTVKFVHTTSWGVSWRMLGALIMVHGDDRGLRIPPKMAPLEAVLVPIVRSGDERAVELCNITGQRLSHAGFRVRVDARDAKPGWKYSEWDLRGVPVRIEIGPRDVDSQTAVLARRDRGREDGGQRRSVALAELPDTLRDLLEDIQGALFAQAKAFLTDHTFVTTDRAEFFERCKNRSGMIDIAWCERPECEARVKAETAATSRVLRELEECGLACTACGEPAKVRAYFAQSY